MIFIATKWVTPKIQLWLKSIWIFEWSKQNYGGIFYQYPLKGSFYYSQVQMQYFIPEAQ